ncbi:hypothetical protein D9758_000016 [Tetrapyrgos nigripes]|uniref:Gpi16 subunit, GPI transamidase component n=1 Tax=Tetrapyrgos nigripes TaxID=182062 RepID=A0A8H5H1D1_9AGAR|nr:hypothetical protein D9758_000016 [Tetrapyrgos nigripes]
MLLIDISLYLDQPTHREVAPPLLKALLVPRYPLYIPPPAEQTNKIPLGIVFANISQDFVKETERIRVIPSDLKKFPLRHSPLEHFQTQAQEWFRVLSSSHHFLPLAFSIADYIRPETGIALDAWMSSTQANTIYFDFVMLESLRVRTWTSLRIRSVVERSPTKIEDMANQTRVAVALADGYRNTDGFFMENTSSKIYCSNFVATCRHYVNGLLLDNKSGVNVRIDMVCIEIYPSVNWASSFLHQICAAGPVSAAEEEFEEELVVKPFADGRVASTFTFKTLLKDASPRDPRTLALNEDERQLLRQYAITELHLTLNAGKWNYDAWGYPEAPGVGTGAELYAWLADGAPASIDERWQGLRNALAGLFCASLGSLDEQRTTSPHLSFPPEGLLPDWDGLPHQIRHASHASEHVCTENLTPFLKLLPCKSLSGLASLLNPHRMFDADWHGMGLHVLWRPEGVEVKLNFQMVSDPLRLSGKKQDWSFHSLYDRTIDRTCPVAKTSQATVSLPFNSMYRITPEPPTVEGNKAVYDLKNKDDESLDIKMEWGTDFEYLQRKLHGSTQDRGHLALTLKNHEPKDISVSYLETMPWLVQFYLHTIEMRVDGVKRDDLISNISYVLPVPHSRPATFHSILTLPAHSTVTFTIDVTKAFLMYTEHPPDAQRGWDLPPAVFVLLPSPSGEDYTNTVGGAQEGSRIYTPSLLVDLATPDFSMPYNVIIFTCSVVAFIFGSVFNQLTRKFVVVRLEG